MEKETEQRGGGKEFKLKNDARLCLLEVEACSVFTLLMQSNV